MRALLNSQAAAKRHTIPKQRAQGTCHRHHAPRPCPCPCPGRANHLSTPVISQRRVPAAARLCPPCPPLGSCLKPTKTASRCQDYFPRPGFYSCTWRRRAAASTALKIPAKQLNPLANIAGARLHPSPTQPSCCEPSHAGHRQRRAAAIHGRDKTSARFAAKSLETWRTFPLPSTASGRRRHHWPRPGRQPGSPPKASRHGEPFRCPPPPAGAAAIIGRDQTSARFPAKRPQAGQDRAQRRRRMRVTTSCTPIRTSHIAHKRSSQPAHSPQPQVPPAPPDPHDAPGPLLPAASAGPHDRDAAARLSSASHSSKNGHGFPSRIAEKQRLSRRPCSNSAGERRSKKR